MTSELPNGIIKDLENFWPIDNLPSDTGAENGIILKGKGNELLQWMTRSGILQAFLKVGRLEGKSLICDIPPGSEIKVTGDPRRIDEIGYPAYYEYSIASLCFGPHYDNSQNKRFLEHPIENYCRLNIINNNYIRQCPTNKPIEYYNGHVPVGWKVTCFHTPNMDYISAATKALTCYSLYDLCELIKPNLSLDSIFSYCKEPMLPYAPLRNSQKELSEHSGFFHYEKYKSINKYKNRDDNEEQEQEEQEDTLVLKELEELISEVVYNPSVSILPNELIEHATSISDDFKSFKLAYLFRDKEGNGVQLLLRLFNYTTNSKLLVPCTLRGIPWQKQENISITPLKGGQILYNLDLITTYSQAKIIMVDSVEIADKNQSRLRRSKDKEEFIWTAFLCDGDENYDQVDWSPLRDREVFFLVTNHSGRSLDQQLLQARKLGEYLTREEIKEKDRIHLQFILLEMAYKDRHQPFINIKDFQNYWKEKPCQLVKESLQLLELEELDEMRIAIINHRDNPPQRCWKQRGSEINNENTGNGSEDETKVKKSAYPYVIRSFLAKGETTFLCAQSNDGKTSLSISMAASVITGRAIFERTWWTVPSSVQKCNPRCVFFNLDMTKAQMDIKKRDYFLPYLDKDKTKRKLQNDRFFVETPTEKECQGFKDGNYSYIIKKVKELMDKNKEKSPLLLVIIDTYKMLCGGRELFDSWEDVSKLLKDLTDMGLAILVTHHANHEKEISGFADKVERSSSVFIIKKNEKGNLSIPATVRVS